MVQRAGECNELFLPSGKVDALLSDNGHQTARQFIDEPVESVFPAEPGHFIQILRNLPETDVFQDCPVEYVDVLRNCRDDIRRRCVYPYPVNFDASRFRGIESLQDLHQRTFPASAFSDDAYDLPFPELHVHILQKQFPAGEPEREILYTEFFDIMQDRYFTALIRILSCSYDFKHAVECHFRLVYGDGDQGK